MPQPLTDQLRTDLIADIKAGELSRNAIARKHKVSPSTVTKYAAQADIAAPFDRSKTAAATHARQVDNTARRAALIDRLYGLSERLLDRAESPYTQVVTGPGGQAAFVTTKLPPLRDVQAAMSAVAMAMDRAGRAEDRNGSGDTDQAKGLLGALFDHLHDQYATHDDPGGG